MSKHSITVRRLFSLPEFNAESLAALAEQADSFASTVYSRENGLPANLWPAARRIAVSARYCMGLLKSSTDSGELMRSGRQLGEQLEEVNMLMAVWDALQQKHGELVSQRQRASIARDRKAQQQLSAKHDWPAIEHRIDKLREAGVSDREMAAEIERLHGVPARTFRARRKKQNGN